MAEARFAGMLDYLAALKRNKLTSDPSKLDALFQACMVDIENAPPIAMGSGTSILKMLAEADVPENWRLDLSNLVQKKVQAGMGSEGLKPKGEKKTQLCENLPNYFLKSDWDNMAADAGVLKKCLIMANRMAVLGLLNPDEPTAVAVVAIAYVAAHKGPMDELRVNPVSALSNVRAFKTHIHGLKGYKKADIKIFPGDPAELPPDLLRRAYGQQMPVKCQVDESAVRFLRDVLPARDSHASIRGMCGKPGLQHLQASQENPQLQLATALREFKQLLFQEGPDNVQLTMLPPKKNKQLLGLGFDSGRSAGSSRDPPAPGPVEPDEALFKDEEEAAPKAEEKEVPATAPSQSAKKDVGGMAKDILEVIEKKPAATQKKTAAKPKADSKSKAAPKKKAALPNKEEPPPKKAKASLPFPGESGEPVRCGNVTIYLCPKSMSYRVKLAGEKKDKAFSWKMDGAKACWARVKEHVLSVAE
eukprot:Skav210509  [mRNA]  locus=scaffold601:541301:542722:+ [translate_table: standard]